jgi:hypothetical protein
MLFNLALSRPVNGIVELAGPDQFRLDGLAASVLKAMNDPLEVITDTQAPYLGARLDHHSLTPRDSVCIAPTRFEAWVSQSVANLPAQNVNRPSVE